MLAPFGRSSRLSARAKIAGSEHPQERGRTREIEASTRKPRPDTTRSYELSTQAVYYRSWVVAESSPAAPPGEQPVRWQSRHIGRRARVLAKNGHLRRQATAASVDHNFLTAGRVRSYIAAASPAVPQRQRLIGAACRTDIPIPSILRCGHVRTHGPRTGRARSKAHDGQPGHARRGVRVPNASSLRLRRLPHEHRTPREHRAHTHC